MSAPAAEKTAPGGLNPLDEDRAASLADEGGASAATVEGQEQDLLAAAQPAVLPATVTGEPEEGPGILPATPDAFGAADTLPLRTVRRER